MSEDVQARLNELTALRDAARTEYSDACDRESAIAAANKYYDSDTYDAYDVDDEAYVESFLGEGEDESIEDSWVEG